MKSAEDEGRFASLIIRIDRHSDVKKNPQPSIYIESGQKGRVGVLRDLRQIQLSVPDKYFFVNRYRKRESSAGKKDSSGFFSGFKRGAGRKTPKIDIAKAVEKVKPFHLSFQIKNEGRDYKKTAESELMSVSAMNEFRKEVREAASSQDADFRWLALEAIVKYIDLKNSGVVKDKTQLQQECMRKIGEALHEDGGLSMFHTTWFLTVYKDYLAGFRMFRPGEVDHISRQGDREAKTILKKLQRRQLEIPIYLRMVEDKVPEVRQLIRYSKDSFVKASRHGQRGCSRADIKQIFLDQFKNIDATTAKNRVSEVNIVMSYALLFARIPMLYEVVEMIKSAITNISGETRLYQHKISIAQKTALLDIAYSLYSGDSSEESRKKLFQLAQSVFQYCQNIITEHRLQSKTPESAIQAHPLMKQAAVLIVYRKAFSRHKETYADMVKRALEGLKPVKQGVRSADQMLIRIAGFAEQYEQKLETLAYELSSSDSPPS